jgi:beta-glucosidase
LPTTATTPSQDHPLLPHTPYALKISIQVVAQISGPRVLDAWIEHENITAVIYSGLLGQVSGNAIADVLYGDVNPSGKLIHNIAKNESDYPASVCETSECPFSEGVYVDYRWFDKNDIEPR